MEVMPWLLSVLEFAYNFVFFCFVYRSKGPGINNDAVDGMYILRKNTQKKIANRKKTAIIATCTNIPLPSQPTAVWISQMPKPLNEIFPFK